MGLQRHDHHLCHRHAQYRYPLSLSLWLLYAPGWFRFIWLGLLFPGTKTEEKITISQYFIKIRIKCFDDDWINENGFDLKSKRTKKCTKAIAVFYFSNKMLYTILYSETFSPMQ